MRAVIALFLILTVPCLTTLFLNGSKDEHERQLEDEEQLAWIREWNRKKGK